LFLSEHGDFYTMIGKIDIFFLNSSYLVSEDEADIFVFQRSDLAKIHASGSLFEDENYIPVFSKIPKIVRRIFIVFPCYEILRSNGGFGNLFAGRSRSESRENDAIETGAVTGTEQCAYIQDGTDIVEKKDFHLTL